MIDFMDWAELEDKINKALVSKDPILSVKKLVNMAYDRAYNEGYHAGFEAGVSEETDSDDWEDLY